MFPVRKCYPIILIAGVIILTACGSNQSYVKCEGLVWNTLYHITYQGPESLQDSILPVLNEVSHSVSVFDKNSLVSKLNESDSLMVDSHFIAIYDASKRIYDFSDGRFDPTVSPLIDAWGFGKNHTVSADTLAIDSIRRFIGLDKTRRNKETIIKDDKRTRFNFSAIAKGYGCDAVGEMLLRNGVENFMVEIGGELTLHGKSPSGNDWTIAIDAPVEDNNPGEESAMIISITDVGIATSGNYRNYRVENGIKTAHTISPVTGRPFISEILSATVIAPDCMEADGIATACMAGSFEQAKEMILSLQLPALLITTDSIWTSPAFPKPQ